MAWGYPIGKLFGRKDVPPPDLSKWEPIVVERNLELAPMVSEVPTSLRVPFEAAKDRNLEARAQLIRPTMVGTLSPVSSVQLIQRQYYSAVGSVSVVKATVAVSASDYDAFLEWKKAQECPEPTVLEPKKLRLIDVE